MLLPGPDTRVVELRVHGMLGTRPESLVSAIAAVDVAGDGVGRIVRPADRLRRPAPGPVLEAEGRSLPRTVEGYLWGAMTSGGWAKAAWALLFPFSLANVAHWMLPPIPPGSRLATALGGLARSLLRLAAVLLTILLVSQVAVVSVDLIATQCLAPDSACLTAVPRRVRDLAWLRPVVGLLPVLLVVFVLHRVSTVAWDVDAPATAPSRPNAGVTLPGTNLAADPDTPTLRTLHTLAALATIALLALGGPLTRPDGPALVVWGVAVGLLGVALLGVLLLDDPTAGAPVRGLRRVLGSRVRRVLVGLGVAAVVGAGIARRTPGTDTTVELEAAALIVITVLLAVVLVPAALLARRTWSAQPREVRPWAGGWMSAPVLAVGALLGGGFGAGLAIAVRRFVDADELVLPRGYEPVTLLWGAGAVLAAVVGVPFAALVLARGWRIGRTDDALPRLLHQDRPADATAALRAWRRADWQRRNAHRVLLALAAVLSAGTAIALVLRLRGIDPAPWTRPVSALGVLALGLLAGALLRAVYTAAREPESARHLGVLADLACFWPREAHPTVPPCYALKVIPELAARATEHLRQPGTRVVFTGHSQGGLLIAVAAARLLRTLPEADRERIGIVTAGSQLQWAYPRAFPGVVPWTSLAELHAELGGRWRALCRGTDPLGSSVTTWRRQVVDGRLLGIGLRVGQAPGPLPPATRSPSGALVLGSDHWLPDPQLGPVPGRRWAPGVLGHTHYTEDPEWDRAIALAAGLDPNPPEPIESGHLDWHPMPAPRPESLPQHDSDNA